MCSRAQSIHYLAGIMNFEDLQGNVLLGNSWEGYAIEQIKQSVSDDIELYYYRTHNGTESDLVLVRGNKPLSCIEIKYTASPKSSKGFQIAIEDLKTDANFIITPKSYPNQASQNVMVCNLANFLFEQSGLLWRFE
ncbi:DUF4143 domain-containing protein [candidate division KSB1 bacterium]|nr:DUF4143 domain-containing protein [candidate division KSB1 bacterium]